MTYCKEWPNKQQKINDLEEEIACLKTKLHYQERTAKKHINTICGAEKAAEYWRSYANTALIQYKNPLWTNRGGMKLFLVDHNLEAGRVCVAEGDKKRAKGYYEAARLGIAESGYHRRDGEVLKLKESMGD